MNTPLFPQNQNLKRIAQALKAPLGTKPLKREAQADDLIDKWCEKNGWHFESGTSNLTALVRDLGYSDISYFLTDNPGAQEAIVEFIRDQISRIPEWQENLQSALGGEESDLINQDDPDWNEHLEKNGFNEENPE